MFGVETGVLLGAVGLGLLHGVEPGHGWPVAATYALDRRHKWGAGLVAGTILGVGHLISSIAVVAAYFYLRSAVEFARFDEPVTVVGVALGNPAAILAGVLLVVLGVREYRHGHGHDHGGNGGQDHGHGHDPDHGEHDDHDHHRDQADHDHRHDDHRHLHHADHDHHHHDHAADADDSSLLSRAKAALPFVGDDGHTHPDADAAADRGLLGIAGFAFLLGFAHEEEFQIIALCVGSNHCLELMLLYAVTVILGIVALTLLLVAGYEHYEDRVAGLSEHFSTLSAVILVGMGLAFALGLF